MLEKHKYDKVNISDEVKTRSPLAKKAYDNAVKAYRKILRTQEDVQLETDINVQAELELATAIKFVAVEKSAAGNLISVEIKSGLAVEVKVKKFAIIITTDGAADYDALIAAIQANAKASALVSVSALAQSTDIAVAVDPQFLVGGK